MNWRLSKISYNCGTTVTIAKDQQKLCEIDIEQGQRIKKKENDLTEQTHFACFVI